MDARSRLLVLTLGVCLSAVTAQLTAQEAKPAESEVRHVAVERAVVYAGPSEDYYPTSVLKPGDTVEVFEQTDDGWLAIRPPKGSFSWVPATQGFLLPGGRVVEVTDAEAVSWIGSSLGTAKQYRWQVRLNRGEQLTVIGEQTLTDEQSDKKALWYKIAPPNGEFRWISERAVSGAGPSENGVATSDEPSIAGSDGEVITATATEDGRPQSILQASSEEPTDADVAASYADQPRSQRGQVRRQPTPDAYSGEDRWNTWHAVEFKNGSFSFPGVARMLGMEPTPSRGGHDAYDPFDLASPATMAKPNSIRADATSAPDSSSSTHAGSDEGDVPLGPRKTRGWRNPQHLREMRERGPTGVTGNLSQTGEEPIGTGAVSGVITASATGSVNGTGGSADDAQWYGIAQAPQASGYKPLALQQADLSEVQVLLSEMVAGPEHTWNLAPLADRTRYLIEHGATAIERGEARLLLDRIEAFADVARRSTELGMTPPVALPAAVNASISASPSAAAAAHWASPLGLTSAVTEVSSGSAPRFDATGWIVPVHSSNPDMPTHALTNDTGRIIVYLSSAAGVNLARYQGQAVGVYGLRGYLPQLRANHIQVQRAVRLH